MRHRLILFRNLYRAEWKLFSLVKKTQLSERAPERSDKCPWGKFWVFRDKRVGVKESGSYPTRSPFREFSCILLLRSKEVWEHHKGSVMVKLFQLNKTLNITIHTHFEPYFIFIYYNSKIKVKLYLYQGGLWFLRTDY
jgi:hypothetical protein